MCNDYEQQITWAQYKQALELVSVTIPPRQGAFDLTQAGDMRINDIAPVMRRAGAVFVVALRVFTAGDDAGAPEK